MYDAVSGSAIPLNAVIVAGYVDGSYGPNDVFGSGWSMAAWNHYPNAYHVTITTGGTAAARVADCESGAMTVPRTVAWAQEEISASRRPTIYADAWDWQHEVDPALSAVGLERVRDLDGWVAHSGAAAVVPAGFVAIQYAQDQPGINGGRVDISVTNGIWPGAVPVVPTNVPGDLFNMLASDPAFAVRYLYRVCLHREADASGFSTNVNFLNSGGTLNQVMTNLQDSAEGQAVIAAERKSLGLS